MGRQAAAGASLRARAPDLDITLIEANPIYSSRFSPITNLGGVIRTLEMLNHGYGSLQRVYQESVAWYASITDDIYAKTADLAPEKTAPPAEEPLSPPPEGLVACAIPLLLIPSSVSFHPSSQTERCEPQASSAPIWDFARCVSDFA